MKKLSLRFSALLATGAALLLLPLPNAAALEMRSWLKIDGTQIEAELIRQIGGTDVELRDKDGRVLKVAKATLSFGDLDYVEENAPADKTAKTLGSTAKPKLPNPAKEVKIDTKAFKMEAGLFKINSRSYRICETPHFKVMYIKPTDPLLMAELAERLWVDTAFFHSTFIPKWHDRKMAIILVDSEEAFGDVGSWYADLQSLVGTPEAKDAAERTRKIWPTIAAGGVIMPAAQADEQKIFNVIRVFRNYRMVNMVDSNGKVVSTKKEAFKGLWVPFFVNTLSSDLIGIQAGNDVSGATPQGEFAIFTGHAYYKEVSLAGKSETSRAFTEGTGKDVGSAGGFKKDKWGSELRKMMKKGGDWAPNLEKLMATKSNDTEQKSPEARTREIVFAYAFASFLQSTPERLSAYNKLCQKIDVANQVPDIEEISKMYGYENAEAFKKAWVTWMESVEFK